jgi:hypothetical protein
MRPKLSEKYTEEREKICSRILEILELDEKGAFVLLDLDSNIEMQNKIMDMKDEIRKCFSCCNMSPFKPSATCKRPYLSVAKNILRKQGYTFIGNDYTTRPAHVKTTRYYIFR